MDRDSQLDTHTQTLSPALFASAIKPRDLPAFYNLQERNRERIRLLFQAFEYIESAPTLSLGYDMAAAQFGKQKGFTPGMLRKLYTAWRKTRDWRELVNDALEGGTCSKTPEDFIVHFNTLVDGNPRSIRAVIKRLRADWTLGKHIPGYGTWRDWWSANHPGRPMPRTAPPHPPGWNQRTLYRKRDSSDFRRKAATIGLYAARKHRPLVLTTRKGCWVGSHYMFDDRWHNKNVNCLVERQSGRPLELFSHDYLSASLRRWGMRVRTEKADGTMQGLTSRMMRMVVAATFYLDGYSPRGTTCVLEHGTASINFDLEKMLYDGSGGLILCHRSGEEEPGMNMRMSEGEARLKHRAKGAPRAHDGAFAGRWKGNPNFKASLESHNNLVQNMEGHLVGETGLNRDRCPESLHGLMKYNERLLEAYAALPVEYAQRLEFPVLDIRQYMQVISEIYRFIDCDPEHELEGWEECGFVTADVHLLGRWMSQRELMTLPASEREIALAILNNGGVPNRPRRLTRGEVWHAGAADLLRIHGGTVCNILGDDFAAERPVRGHQFVFEDKEVGPGEHRFEGIITDHEGRESFLKEGDKYKVFVNPFAANQLFVQDARGRFLGIAKRCERASRADLPAIRDRQARARHIEAELLAPLRQRQAGAAKAKTLMHENNARVLSDVAAAKAAFIQDATAALDASLPDPNPTTNDNAKIDPTDW